MAQNASARAQQNYRLTKKERHAGIGKTDKKRETAEYITEMVPALRNLARAAGLETLSALLELSYYEAYAIAHEVEFPPAEVKRIEALEKAAKDLA